MKKDVLKNFTAHVFSCEFCKFFQNTFFTEDYLAKAFYSGYENYVMYFTIFIKNL